jgi:hypothetical protein
VVDEWSTCMEWCWSKAEEFGWSVLKCDFVERKSHMNWLRVRSGRSREVEGNWLFHPWHVIWSAVRILGFGGCQVWGKKECCWQGLVSSIHSAVCLTPVQSLSQIQLSAQCDLELPP